MKAIVQRRRSSLAAAGAAFALLAASAASAQQAERPRDGETAAESRAAAQRAVNAQAPNARLAALIDAGGEIIREKGVQSVSRIAEGVYCIRPEASTGINPDRVIVTVSAEYFYSQLDEVMVQWASRKHGCGSDRIAVYTLADFAPDAEYEFSNNVGFSVIVP